MTRRNYEGRDVIVSFDPETCQHSGNCARGLAGVFQPDRRPWIDPDQADADDVVTQVAQCPSGALRIEARPE